MKYKQTIKYSILPCLIIILSLSIFFSCNKYEEILSDVSKIKIIIYMREENNINREDYFIEIIDTKEIKIISQYITNIPSPSYKCGYNGGIEFYCKNDNVLLEAEFNSDCNTIVFVYDDKSYRRRISNKGIEYITKIIKEIEEKTGKKNYL
jgi:hypothetical protein